MNAISEFLNKAIGNVSITDRMIRVVDVLKSSHLSEQEVREIVCGMEKIFQNEFFKNGRGKDDFHSPSIYFHELFKLLRDEKMYEETVVGHNIIDDTLDKVLAIMTERLIDECTKLMITPDYTNDVLIIAIWLNAKVSKNHRGKTNHLLRFCGERLDRKRLLAIINLKIGFNDFYFLNSLGNLEDAQNLLATGLVIQLGAKKMLNQALEAEAAKNLLQDFLTDKNIGVE